MSNVYVSLADLREAPYSIKLHRETIRVMMARGTFPRAHNLTGTDNKYARRSWLESEVLAWLKDRAENRKTYTAPKPKGKVRTEARAA